MIKMTGNVWSKSKQKMSEMKKKRRKTNGEKNNDISQLFLSTKLNNEY
jgi:hypothetical protein